MTLSDMLSNGLFTAQPEAPHSVHLPIRLLQNVLIINGVCVCNFWQLLACCPFVVDDKFISGSPLSLLDVIDFLCTKTRKKIFQEIKNMICVKPKHSGNLHLDL